jgi:hypothetical protein
MKADTNNRIEDLETVVEHLRSQILKLAKRKDYAAADLIIEKAIAAHGKVLAVRLYPILWEHAMATKAGKERAYFLEKQSTVDPENVAGEAVRKYQFQLAKDAESYNVLSKSPALKSTWEIWHGTISELERYLSQLPKDVAERHSIAFRDVAVPIILTAGSGRSGSSAVFDWINGFSSILGVRDQHFYLRDFVAVLSQKPGSLEYKKLLIDILWRTFLGRHIYTTKAGYRKVDLARRTMKALGDANVASTCREVIRILTHEVRALGINTSNADESAFSYLPALIATIRYMFGSPELRFAATGWLDFDMAKCYPAMSNVQMVCSVRDPRDVYAEHLLLTRTFDRNVINFIDDYRGKMKSLECAVNDSSKTRNVIVVRFEDFVRSDDDRRTLADKLGIDVSGGQKAEQRYPFVPARSQANVGVYRRCEDQVAMAEIGEALAEYCV